MKKNDAAGTSRTGYFTISEVARILGVSSSTLRMWENVRLVAPQRSDGGYRLYTQDDVKRLQEIKFLISAKRLNLSGVLHFFSQEKQKQPAASRAKKSLSPPPSKTIGDKLRELRLAQNLKLKDVAERANLSVGFLSSLERSQTNASIATVQKLSKIYNTTFLSFFEDSEPPSKVVRSDERKALETQSGARIELLALGQTMMETQLWRIAPGASSGGAYHHEGEEFIYVLKGAFEIWLDEAEYYFLKTGDSLYFPSTQAHRWINPGKTETTLLWVNTPPTF